MPPYLFFALQERWICSLEADDLRMAKLCETMVNIWRGKKGKKAEVKDFLPDRRGKKGKKTGKQQTWQQQLEFVKVLHGLFGGKGKAKVKKEEEHAHGD